MMQIQEPESNNKAEPISNVLKSRSSIYKDLFQVHTRQLVQLHSEDNALTGLIYIITTVKI